MIRYVLSYPKCGRTWVRVFMKWYFDLLGGDMPEIFYVHKERDAFKQGHKRGDTDFRCVLLWRQPCDVMVSHYFEKTVRGRAPRSKGIYDEALSNISSFIRNKDLGIKEYRRSLTKWLSPDRTQLVIEYERLFDNIWAEILTYFELPVDIDAIAKINEECKFENIRNDMDRFLEFKVPKRYFAIENRRSTANPKNPEAHKFRRGKVGGYVDYLSPEDIKYIEKEWGKL